MQIVAFWQRIKVFFSCFASKSFRNPNLCVPLRVSACSALNQNRCGCGFGVWRLVLKVCLTRSVGWDNLRPTMRLIGIWLVLVGAAAIASAQTNSGASTNNPQAMYAPEQPQVQTNSPANVRKLSLQDCIELALKHNLDLQIDRINPA